MIPNYSFFPQQHHMSQAPANIVGGVVDSSIPWLSMRGRSKQKQSPQDRLVREHGPNHKIGSRLEKNQNFKFAQRGGAQGPQHPIYDPSMTRWRSLDQRRNSKEPSGLVYLSNQTCFWINSDMTKFWNWGRGVQGGRGRGVNQVNEVNDINEFIFGFTIGWFWCHIGMMLRTSWGDLGIILGAFCDILGSSWAHAGSC